MGSNPTLGIKDSVCVESLEFVLAQSMIDVKKTIEDTAYKRDGSALGDLHS